MTALFNVGIIIVLLILMVLIACVGKTDEY